MKRRAFVKVCIGGLVTLISSPLDLFAKDAKMCVVLDDAGCKKTTVTTLEELAKREIPVTVAVLPHSNYEKDVLGILSGYRNADILIHQPMEPLNMKSRGLQKSLETYIREEGEEFDPKKHVAIYDFDSPEDARIIIDYNMRHLNGYLDKLSCGKKVVGLNNHMGSLITQREDIMREIALYCLKNNLILLDSRTTPESVMYDIGKKIGAKVYRNSGFIDKDVLEQLRRYHGRVREGKMVIAIGHLQYIPTVNAYIQFSEGNKDLVRISQL